MRHLSKEKNIKSFEFFPKNLLRFLSLRYSANFRRSRLVYFLNVCNVRQSALQKFLKISIKNSKCAVSNKHIQDGRPGRYENRRGSKKKAKHSQEDFTPPPRNEDARDVVTQKARESGILPSDSKKTGFRQKSAK